MTVGKSAKHRHRQTHSGATLRSARDQHHQRRHSEVTPMSRNYRKFRALQEAIRIVNARKKAFDDWDEMVYGSKQEVERWLEEHRIPYLCYPPAEKRYSLNHIINTNNVSVEAFIQQWGSHYNFLKTDVIYLNIREMWDRGIQPGKIQKTLEWWR